MHAHLRLKKCPLFKDIADSVLISLEQNIRWKSLHTDDVVCRKGDATDGLYILITGQLLVYDLLHNGQEVSLSAIAPGSFFGELSVIDQLPRTAFIKATQPCLVGCLPLASAQSLFYTHPVVAQRLMAHLVAKVREMTIQRVLLSLPQAFQRVCAWLTHSQIRTPEGGWLVRDVPKQQDLANMLNTSRETVSRSLARLTRDGVIAKGPLGLWVMQPQSLVRLAQEDSLPLLHPSSHKSI